MAARKPKPVTRFERVTTVRKMPICPVHGVRMTRSSQTAGGLKLYCRCPVVRGGKRCRQKGNGFVTRMTELA